MSWPAWPKQPSRRVEASYSSRVRAVAVVRLFWPGPSRAVATHGRLRLTALVRSETVDQCRSATRCPPADRWPRAVRRRRVPTLHTPIGQVAFRVLRISLAPLPIATWPPRRQLDRSCFAALLPSLNGSLNLPRARAGRCRCRSGSRNRPDVDAARMRAGIPSPTRIPSVLARPRKSAIAARGALG